MAAKELIAQWLPPTPENYATLLSIWQLFPLITIAQWFITWYPIGKTSTPSRLNVNGRVGWVLGETPGIFVLLYTVYTLPTRMRSPYSDDPSVMMTFEQLPWANKTLAGLFCLHYINRGFVTPVFLNPSMAPGHVTMYIWMFIFNVINAVCIGSWLGGYGPKTWYGSYAYGDQFALARAELGLMMWAVGFAGNIWHDDELREIRRQAMKRKQAKKQDGTVENKEAPERIYRIPRNGLFEVCLYPHYLLEWFEWAGFWLVGGWSFVPARIFLVNEVTTMLPRAVQGKKWYIERFGKEKVGNRYAIIPGVI